MQRRPIPIDLKVRDLDPRERLCMECPSCRKVIGRQGYDVSLGLPPEYLVIRYVARHWCRECSRKGVKVRAEGWIETWPKSGAEGRFSAARSPASALPGSSAPSERHGASPGHQVRR